MEIEKEINHIVHVDHMVKTTDFWRFWFTTDRRSLFYGAFCGNTENVRYIMGGIKYYSIVACQNYGEWFLVNVHTDIW